MATDDFTIAQIRTRLLAALAHFEEGPHPLQPVHVLDLQLVGDQLDQVGAKLGGDAWGVVGWVGLGRLVGWMGGWVGVDCDAEGTVFL
jgi:hypothetical protein